MGIQIKFGMVDTSNQHKCFQRSAKENSGAWDKGLRQNLNSNGTPSSTVKSWINQNMPLSRLLFSVSHMSNDVAVSNIKIYPPNDN